MATNHEVGGSNPPGRTIFPFSLFRYFRIVVRSASQIMSLLLGEATFSGINRLLIGLMVRGSSHFFISA